uniref:Uncharacterized protein n=1 Tax=Arundo donax TaxID=35708 RepID=A0A0A9E6H6_ARUDO
MAPRSTTSAKMLIGARSVSVLMELSPSWNGSMAQMKSALGARSEEDGANIG